MSGGPAGPALAERGCSEAAAIYQAAVEFASIAFDCWSQDVTSILRGLACSATGIVSVKTPRS